MIAWSLVRLRMLSELHRLGTLAEVARSMSYSPSAVSQQLAQLERESGTTLLERVGRRVRLTDAALILVEHADAVLERLERAESHLAHARPETAGTLHVASFQTSLLSIAPPALSLLAERHPALRITITQQELAPSFEGLLTREFDLILGEEFPGVHEELRPGVDRAHLVSDPLLLVLPREGPWSRPARLTDLAAAPWALDLADTPAGAWARSALRTAGFEPEVRFDSPDPLLQAHLVRSGHAVALIPSLIAARTSGGRGCGGSRGTRDGRSTRPSERVAARIRRSGRSAPRSRRRRWPRAHGWPIRRSRPDRSGILTSR